ncbi:hypothetical protein [Actinoplanes sp. DH11]|uniref:hypothetical protein n=1 Tax=Actinoplanes sp. DH11 TaxID=2857011 RepID=UPI001E5D1D28|nr:hypothetical protein [Actinoplanes sp. DH11]
MSKVQRAEILGRAARLIAEVNAGSAQCFEGVAILERSANLLAIKANPVAVALAAQGPIGSRALGDAVDGVIPVFDGGTVMRSADLTRWAGAGHLVLHAPQAGLLFDPTLNQVSAGTGFPTGALIMPVTAADLVSDLQFEISGGCLALYRPVPSDRTWTTAYNAEYARRGADAMAVTRRALELEGFDENLV